MTLRDHPVVETLRGFESRDPVFDGLILAGPLVVAVVVGLGRRPLTMGLAAAYILVFGGYVLARFVRRRRRG